MKFLCTGDWHITASPPKKRKDEYIQTQENKIKFILSLAKERGCSFILQPGDFYDHHTEPFWLVRKYVKLIEQEIQGSPENPHIYTLFGQHDQRYHTVKIENTPLGMTEVSPYIHLLGTDPYFFGTIEVYGADWSQDIPPIKNKEAFNILVLHRMIIKDKLWEQQEDYCYSSHLLRKNEFDLIVSGDNHTLFTQTTGKKHLLNCGSLMRSTLSQEKHIPTVFIVEVGDTLCDVEAVPIPIHDFKFLFDTEKENQKKKENEQLKQFIQKLSNQETLTDLNFYNNLMEYIEKENVSSSIKSIIQSTIQT